MGKIISEDVKQQTKEIEWEEFNENLEEIDINIFKPLGEKDTKEIIDADPI